MLLDKYGRFIQRYCLDLGVSEWIEDFSLLSNTNRYWLSDLI